jgi:glutamate dehydrogenase
MDNGNDARRHQALLASIEGALDKRAKRIDLLRSFTRQYFEKASADALRQRTPDQLAALVQRHFEFAGSRVPGQALIRVLPPAEGSDIGAMATLETVFDDMPFLVDSAAMAVRDAGASVDWSVHPIMRIRRDRRGRLLEVCSEHLEQPAESMIHLEFEPLASAKAYAELEQRLHTVFADVARMVGDYGAMMQRLHDLVATLASTPTAGDQGRSLDDVAEARAFIEWLGQDHFTFIGYAFAAAYSDDAGNIGVKVVPEQSLGLLRADACFGDTEQTLAPEDELNRHVGSGRLVVVTKANVRSHIHHPHHIDAVSVKQYDSNDNLVGTHRFLGLFSSEVYTAQPQDIPLVRRKADYVIRRSRLDPESHSGKHLREILHQLPRDELFQSSEDELFRLCTGIRALRDRHQLRLFARCDRYGRFHSFLIYLPRDRYNSELRDRVASELRRMLDGSAVERSVEFLRGGLTRMHVIVRTPVGTRLQATESELEQRLIEVTRSWRDQLREALLRDQPQRGAALAARFADAFPLGYQHQATPEEAVGDLYFLDRLDEQTPLLPCLDVDEDAQGAACPTRLKLYAWKQPKSLSDILPTLENFGLRVIRQEPARITPRDGAPLWIQVFEIRAQGDCPLSPQQQKQGFEEALTRCLRGETEDDGLHRLVLAAGLDSRQVVAMRAITRYLLQTGLPFSRDTLERTLAANASAVRLLMSLFEARFDPSLSDARRKSAQSKLEKPLAEALDAVRSLDTDRMLRAYHGVIRACLRTNYYQRDADDRPKPCVSLKLDPAKVPELPAPRPVFETFVYAPEVEGIHLRGGKVARGGLRWSDRREDFRTEVLGLMKAQMVKNAIIVPVGAKGGFVVKNGDASDRAAWREAGEAAYRIFVRGLLDITDNRDGARIVPPEDVVRHDADDPYLVVAADKGTATFSDMANGLAAEYDFWLSDAFASGGSQGYDHKKMGITARGGWESVKRHFRELPPPDGATAAKAGHDIQGMPFTCVGIGDMGGDVFGNGMLLSKQTRLIAAFNHLHIFIDPDPDAASSFAERRRLFKARSGWDGYNTELISKGGGIWSRQEKQITLSAPAQKALGTQQSSFTPNELLRTILLAPVDLLWNGGIGTYVKSQHESHQDVGDRANDAIRVNGRELRARVVGEGGNLGCTQLGRIEYALMGAGGSGGRINTDAIDNSGGVHSSDREVNIKIALNQLLRNGSLKQKARDALLEGMTEDVAKAVLRDSYVQSLALSLIDQDASNRLEEHGEIMRVFEREAGLVRSVEGLPDDEQLAERRTRGRGLTRPESAVMLAYAKNALFDALVASEVPDDRAFEPRLMQYFPPAMRDRHAKAISEHRLRREIIATQLANQVVNRMGFAFVHRLADEQGQPPATVIKAFAVATMILDAPALFDPIDGLDLKVRADTQLQLYGRVEGLLRHLTSWLLSAHWSARPVGDAIKTFGAPLGRLVEQLPNLLPEAYREDWTRAATQWRELGVPKALATQMANTRVLGSAPDIIEMAADAGCDVETAADVYFAAGERLHLLWLLSAIIALQVNGRWQALARANLREDSYRLQRKIAARILAETRGRKSGVERVEEWLLAHGEPARQSLRRMEALRAHSPHDFMTLAVGVRELRRLRLI